MKQSDPSKNRHTLGNARLGHIRHIANLANQIPGDWSNMGPYDPTQEGDDTYRYQLAYMTYTLGLAQYHHTPAYRELYRDTMARLIEKMMRYDVWGYWELSSRGSKAMDPDITELDAGRIDPVIRQNVMYSGHLLMMISLYEMLYRDGRYDADGALTFRFRPVQRGFGPEDFPYDHHKLTEAIFGEFERNEFMGCECEPNGIFVYCNQFPMLGFMHYDHVHGTDFAERSIPRFREHWKRRSDLFQTSLDAKLPVFYRIKQDEVINEPRENNGESVTSVSWGAVMHVWAKEYVESVYPRSRDRILRKLPDGTLGVRMDRHVRKYEDYQVNPGHHSIDPMMLGVHLFGTLALAAAEVGDQETLQGMLQYADDHMRPTWNKGGLFYPRNDDLGDDAYTTAVVGNALVAGARLCPRDGFWSMYNEPWSEEVLHQPQLCDVSYPDVLVNEATFDEDSQSLVATLAPGDGCERKTVSVSGLDLSRRHRVELEDGPDLEVGATDRSAEAEGLQVALDQGSEKLKVTLDLSRERRFVVRQVPH